MVDFIFIRMSHLYIVMNLIYHWGKRAKNEGKKLINNARKLFGIKDTKKILKRDFLILPKAAIKKSYDMN